MKELGHRDCVAAALNHEDDCRVPVNNFALVTAARSAGYRMSQARSDPKISARVSVDYAVRTGSDFVKPILDSQVPFKDLGMKVDFPDDDYGVVPKPIAKTEKQIDDLALFDPWAAEECPMFTSVFVDSLEETARILPEDLHICGLSWGPISTAGYIMGVEDMLMSALFDGDIVKKLISKVTGFVSAQQRRMLEAGATVMWMADPTASQDLISPDMFEEFCLGGIKKVVDDVKDEYKDAPTFVHICGNTLDVMDIFPRTGADCISFDHAVDPGSAKSKSKGRFTIMGNIDPVNGIMMGTPDSIRKECFGIMDAAAEGGGFILAPGCETPISSPDENVIAMCDAARDYRKHRNRLPTIFTDIGLGYKLPPRRPQGSHPLPRGMVPKVQYTE
ncbi:MAG: uroporphyrinogen decarboxylase family protein [Candidatus Methanomethylophilaceae archaeon]|nr:uroporphyrinogen decarboxylase family protein [Candidatus Methanomethylophilaceae archaeon]